MASQPRTITPAKLYGEAGLLYIRYHAKIETKPNGQKKVGGTRPAFSKITKQIEYQQDAGKYYSLLMGREFKPGRWVLLLDFDNKVEGDSRNGLELISKLKMDQYNAPCQTTPSGGYHYLFFVDAEQKDQITSKTTITHEGVKYNMDVKFKNSLCNCAPTKIEGYGAYKWVKPGRLRDIPKLPNELYDMIKNKARPERHGEKKDSHNENLDSQSGNLDRGYLKGSPQGSPQGSGSTKKMTEDELHDARALCSCLSLAQLDNYATWIRVGMILKKIGAPCSFWDQVRQRSNKFKRRLH
jgi:hypothetical protein